MSIAYLLSGSNQGDRAQNLENAISLIKKSAGAILECSAVFESASWGFDHPTPFLNQALMIKTSLDPEILLNTLLGIEVECGRSRSGSEEYEARTLDIDILFYDDQVIESKELIIPHPKLHLRRFVLTPLASIAPQFIHPLKKRSIEELLTDCTDDSIVRKFNICSCCNEKEVRDAL